MACDPNFWASIIHHKFQIGIHQQFGHVGCWHVLRMIIPICIAIAHASLLIGCPDFIFGIPNKFFIGEGMPTENTNIPACIYPRCSQVQCVSSNLLLIGKLHHKRGRLSHLIWHPTMDEEDGRFCWIITAVRNIHYRLFAIALPFHTTPGHNLRQVWHWSGHQIVFAGKST